MHSSTLDRTQSQYERKLARQKQLDLMEAAAAGQPFDTVSVNSPDVASVSSRSSSSHQAPEGAIESARRFLWDEDDVVVPHVTSAMSHSMTSVSAYDMYSSDHQIVGLMKTSNGHATVTTGPQQQQSSSAFGFGSRMANTIMGTFSRRGNRYDDDDDDDVVNIAPRRGRGTNAFVSDAHAREADEYIDSKRSTVRRTSVSGDHDGSGGFLAAISECCLLAFHTMVGAFGILCEYIAAWWAGMNPKLCAMIICVLTGIGLVIFAIVAIASRANSSSAASADLPQVVDTVRYDTIRGIILESQFTSADALDLAGTAQNYALRWLTDEDPAKLRDDDDALLQRYALATFLLFHLCLC
ncbi:hypothetical protein MHU86_22105 [Fragilaria crotonensis]|nr:hypothetical protein MHU86_22105 [Fragilaria crotonensis]